MSDKKSAVDLATENGVRRPKVGAGGASFKPLKGRVGLVKGASPHGGRISRKRVEKRELVEQARRDTGRPTMGWKATKKYMRKLERIARIASTVNLQSIE